MFESDNLDAALASLGAQKSSSIFEALRVAHSQPHRHYHTVQHIETCLQDFDELRTHALEPAEVEVALWFHDAVYETRKHDNEERSAHWAWEFLTEAGVGDERVKRIVELILATKTHNARTQDEELIVDIDLGILGSSPEVFESYDQAIRREYDWVEDEAYREGRLQVLRQFLERPTIYRVPEIRLRLELSARINLKRKISELDGELKS